MCIYISYNHVFWKRYAFVLPLGRCDEMEALAPLKTLLKDGVAHQFLIGRLQADATGLKICALAGYDPRLATKFLDRFALFEALEMFGTSFVHFVPLVHVVGSRATQVQRGRALTLPRRRSFKNFLVLLMVCFGLFWTILACWYLRVSPFGAVFPWCLWCLRHASRHWRMPRQMQWNASSSTRHGSGGVLAGLGWCGCAQEKQAP
jgi:hypothetical protein